MKEKAYILKKNRITREIFLTALEELLEEKPFEKISASEIIERSGLSRATFYKHFRDKYELANFRLSDFLLSKGMQEFVSSVEIDQSLADIIHFLDQNKETMKKLLKYVGQNSFGDFYINYSIDVARALADKYARDFTDYDRTIILYHAAGAVEVIKEWLYRRSELTSSDVADIIIQNRSERVKKLYLE